MSISPARIAAFDILLRIERDRSFSSVLLPQFEEHLSVIDRGLCHELVLGTLRRQIKLDRVIDGFASGKKLDMEVRVASRVGLFQLMFHDRIPARAAINESVELVKRAKKTSAAGFVNALLRGAARQPPKINHEDELDRISGDTSHPKWLIERWAASGGLETAEQIATANNAPAKIAFRILRSVEPELDELVSGARASSAVDGCYLMARSTPLLRKLASENKVYLQDEASQLVAKAVEVPRGGRFLDVCAAPGGKTGLIALTTRLTAAGDLYQPRVDLLKENCRWQGVDVLVARYDAAASLPFAEHTFDAVLVDAPCSGTGTIRHHPEIRYFLSAADIEDLARKQRLILREASKAVKSGGLLVYSTCSLEREEGEGVVKAFLDENDSFISITPDVPQRFLTGEGYARTWPHRDDMDGFFIAAFRRR